MAQPDRTPRADRRLVGPAIGAWAATAVGTLLAPRSSVVIAAVASGIAMVAVRRSGRLSALAVGLAVGGLVAAWHVHGLRTGPVPRLAAQHADIDVVARLVRDPATVTTASGSTLTITDVTVTSVLDGSWRASNSPIVVLSYGSGWAGLLPGQRVELTGRLSLPQRGDSVAAVLDARAPPFLIGRPPWWQRAAGRVRIAFRRACSGLPADERGLLPGLVDGDVSVEPAELKNDMRLTGLTHLQAVSGENVSVVAAVTLAVARGVGLRRRARIAVTALALLGFVVLARPSPSVLRAAVMAAIALFAMSRGRRVGALPALSAAVLVLVCVDPFLARSVGFVLSVCATGAILLVAPGWTTRLSRHLPTAVAAAIAVPAAAQLACTPVLILAFGQLTPYAVPANLLAALAVVPATVLGVLCAVSAPVCLPVAVAIAWCAALPTALIAAVARGMAALPAAGLRWPGGAATVAAVLVVLAALLAARSRRRGLSSHRAILGRWSP